MDLTQIRSQINAIESKEIFDFDREDMEATLTVSDHDFDVNGLTYIIEGVITRDMINYHSETYDNPEEVELSEKGCFDGTLTILDVDGEEIYFDDLNIKL